MEKKAFFTSRGEPLCATLHVVDNNVECSLDGDTNKLEVTNNRQKDTFYKV